MAKRTGNMESAGKEGTNRNGKLLPEVGKTKRRVTFREEKKEGNIELELRKLKEWVREEINGIKESIKESLKEGIRNMERKEKVWEVRLSNIEEGIGRMERDVEDLKREYNIAGEEGEVSDSYVGESRESRSRRSNFRGSGSSAISEDRLSSKEVERLRRMVTEKEREQRRNNIVIKGIDVKELDKDRREWAKDFLKSRLGVACGIISVRISGPVIIVKIDKEEDKKWVMRNKNRLKGGKIFIENDLTWEERKRQERIGRWVKEQRNKGEDVKAGYARVRIKGVWKTWEDIERDLNKEDMREGEGGVDEREKGDVKDNEDFCKYAVKEKRKGRAKGGFIIGKRRKWGNRTDRIIGKDEEDFVVSEIEEGKDTLYIISVYNKENWKILEEKIEKWMGGKENGQIIVGGDFNIRIGELGGGEEEEGGIERKSKDKTIGNGGRNLIEYIKEKGWYVLNGSTKGDWEGEYTYVGARGNTVIDYVLSSERVYERVVDFRVGDRVDSDHMPVIVTLEDKDRRGRRREEEEENKKEGEEKWRICWDEESIQWYKENLEMTPWEADRQDTIEEKWDRLKCMIHEAMIKKKVITKRKELGHKDWWDKQCSRKKREVQRCYKRWRKGRVTREKYLEEKKRLRELAEKKQRENREREEKELRNLKNTTQVWSFINKRRKKKEWKTADISKEAWRKHFMNLLEGETIGQEDEPRMSRETEEETIRRRGEQTEGQMEEEEIRDAIRKLKKRKAVGVDGIPMEAWKFGGDVVRKGLVELMRQIWKEGYIPKDWRMSIIVPLYKRGDANIVGNYRSISLLCAAYKIYAEILRNRLEEETERLGLLPESQAGFRKGRATIDNVFVLNHIVQREKMKESKERRIYALFVDLKAAFDNVEREQLWNVLKGKGVAADLVWRMERIYEETKVAVRVKEEVTAKFRTTKGVRQGCVMSPLLFNLYIADIGKELEMRNVGGVRIDNKRLWSLEYADDMVFLAKNREALLDMMQTVKRFLNKRNLILCTEKTKVLVFNRGNRERKESWKWRGKEIEEVNVFKYLGFVFNNKGNYKDHIRDISNKGRLAANKTWGLGERICRDDFTRRWGLFRYLVHSVMSYGVEIWGWEEKKELERIMLDYVRWIFRLDFCTPRYLMTRELRLNKLRIEWGLRAVKYEEKIGEMDENRWMKRCWIEKEKNGWKDMYSREREKYYNRNGWGIEALEDLRQRGIDLRKELGERDWVVQRQAEEGKIREARYNKKYKELETGDEGPSYLRKSSVDEGNIGDMIRALLRVRCGNMEEGNKYWLEEEETLCLFCGKGKDCMSHYVKECERIKDWFKDLGKNCKEIEDSIWSDELNNKKGRILRKLWLEKELIIKNRKRK